MMECIYPLVAWFLGLAISSGSVLIFQIVRLRRQVKAQASRLSLLRDIHIQQLEHHGNSWQELCQRLAQIGYRKLRE